MFTHFYKLRDKVSEDMKKYNTRMELTIEEWSLVKDYVDILKPFEEATKCMSTNQKKTRLMVIPIIDGINSELSEHLDNDAQSVFVDRLKKNMRDKFPDYQNRFPCCARSTTTHGSVEEEKITHGSLEHEKNTLLKI